MKENKAKNKSQICSSNQENYASKCHRKWQNLSKIGDRYCQQSGGWKLMFGVDLGGVEMAPGWDMDSDVTPVLHRSLH